MKNWNEFIENLMKNSKCDINSFASFFGKMKIFFNEGIYLFQPEGESWEYKDTQVIENNDIDYILFKNKMKEFFFKIESEEF